MRLLPCGARAVLVEVDDLETVHLLCAGLRTGRPPVVEDVVAGATTVLVTLNGPAPSAAVLEDVLARAVRNRPDPPGAVTIPVIYDGPDLPAVAHLAGVVDEQVPGIHAAPTYTVAFLGFSPGFAYLVGGDRRLAVPRLDVPRRSVPAGSVAVAGAMSAVYPQATPGGWRLIGRTDAVMFDPGRPEPALLRPGDRVRFEPVAGLAPPVPPPSPPMSSPPSGPSLEILDSGPLLTVQDGGRRGWGAVGVPVAGAADRRSAVRANRLVGNRDDAAVLESTLGACRLRLRAERAVAVTGGRAEVAVDGIPARQDAGLPLRSGAELSVGACRAGTRVYVAVAGGIEVDEVLGSRSTDTLAGLGPPPLQPGAVVPLGDPRPGPADGPVPSPTPVADPGEVVEVAVSAGPRWDHLPAAEWAALAGTEFVVHPSSDRSGVRLDGRPLAVDGDGRLPSEGMVAGAVQVPPGGRPIVLMRNHPPTGGYPVVAVVDDDGIDALAQARPGQAVRLLPRPAGPPAGAGPEDAG